ncbi:prepilin peptidase [Candidatus Woesearchaeota archaeon]|nr:prepilin peptidase [Candidatus Woesearchaeota archaeon]
MLEEILIVSVAVIGLIIATIGDIKHKEVPDYLNYFLIISGLSFRLFYASFYSNWNYFLYGLLGFGVSAVIGLVLYFAKQWGGGDAKLLMALGAIFATKPFFVKNDGIFLLGLFFNIFIAGALYGVAYGVYLAIKNKKDFAKEFKRLLEQKSIKFIRNFSFVTAIVLLLLFIYTNNLATKFILGFFIIFLLFYIYLWVFVKSVENACMFHTIPISKLTDGDWVVEDVKIKGKTLYNKEKMTVNKKEILTFMKEGIKRVKIKTGIPFVPSFLIGTLISLTLGSLV